MNNQKHTPGPWFARKNIDMLDGSNPESGWFISMHTDRPSNGCVAIGGVIAKAEGRES